SNATAKRQAAEQAKAEADAKKEAADEAQDKLSQGAVAYFGDKGASQAVKVLTDPTVTEYLDAIHNGAKGDATTLDNMIEALKFIQEANQLRAKEGLQPLKVSDTLMAQAMADADYANNNVNHPLQFPASENLAWGYTDPFNGWYDTEKSMYEKDMSDGVLDCKASDGKPVKPCAYGHYTTLVNTDFTLTGFGVSQNGNITGIGGNTHSQLFTENANGIGSDAGRIMDVDAYLTDLTAYRDSLTGADAAYQTALAKSKQAAQDASAAAKALAAAQ
ncbi:CAP domain-containing protein, partial [Bifidobacterium longum]